MERVVTDKCQNCGLSERRHQFQRTAGELVYCCYDFVPVVLYSLTTDELWLLKNGDLLDRLVKTDQAERVRLIEQLKEIAENVQEGIDDKYTINDLLSLVGELEGKKV